MSDFDFYPTKPVIASKNSKNNWVLTVTSIFLFIATFLMLFNDSIYFVLCLILILFIHELGHFICMKLFKYENVKMLFVPLMGAFVQGEKTNYSQKQSVFVSMAGPFPGILIGIVLSVLAFYFKSIELLQVGLMFYVLNVFNLLPIDPLDGGQLVRYLFIAKSDFLLFVFSLISSLLMIFIGLYFDSYLIMGFGFLMGIRVRSMQKKINLYRSLDEEGIVYTKTYENLSNKEYHMLRRFSIENTPMLRKYYDLTGEIDESFIANYVKSILRIPIQLDLNLWSKILIILSWILVLVLIPFLIYLGLQKNYIDFSWVQGALQFK